MSAAQAQPVLEALESALQQLGSRGQGDVPTHWVRAPGRVNLIGEHTDYTGGFVLPVAIDREIVGVVRPRFDGRVAVSSRGFGTDEFEIARAEPVTGDWRAYARAVIAELLPHLGDRFGGMDLALATNLPTGAGLASSAALEGVVAQAVLAVTGVSINLQELARLCQRAEHRGPGVACGIMDQLVALASVEGSALMLDCRTLATVAVPFPADRWRIVAIDSGRDRSLASSAYNDRRQACEAALEAIRDRFPEVVDLSEVSEQMLAEVALPAPPDRRSRHVVTENGRVLQFVVGLVEADAKVVGETMAASHASLRDGYQVSSAELDALVTFATESELAIGSRLTGAGFGGCTVNIVPTGQVEPFVAEVQRRFRARFGRVPEAHALSPAAAAEHGRLEA